MAIEDFHISKQVLDRFCVAGINYQKADAATRGLFSVAPDAFSEIAEKARQQGISSIFVVSTCNRTEVYAIAESPYQLGYLLADHVKADKKDLFDYGYFWNGEQALQHLFEVSSGLDSQILGDYEILGQIKRAADIARSQNMIGPVLDRILNFVYQSSKRIKTDTQLSNGTVSVSFAAIELLQELPDIAGKKILVFGAGKFGTNVCKNLRTYLPETAVHIVNRTDDKTRELALEHNLSFVPYEQKEQAIADADIIIVCTNANEPTILPDHITPGSHKLLLDLSVPLNVHPDVAKLDGVRVIDVDEISTTILDKTLSRRRAEVPAAKRIIESYKDEFKTWLREYHYALHLKTWKNKLHQISASYTPRVCEFYNDQPLIEDDAHTAKAQKALKQLAVNLKVKQDKGCQFINSINDYLQMP
ncbi:MAG: glutamyl-tRNA reductase [Niabella sp.]